MSIIIGLVTDNCGLVASDGRKTSSAIFREGIIIEKAMPDDDNYDKTFILKNGRIIGAVAGLMEIQGIKISNHLEDILVNHCDGNTSIENILQSIKDNMKARLESIPNDEIIFKFRKIDLILIGLSTSLSNNFKIYALSFIPNLVTNTIFIEDKIISPSVKGITYWQLFGDDSSRNAVDSYLEREIGKMPIATEKTLRSLCYKAIRHGIETSSIHDLGDYATCGGKPFVKSLKKG